MSETTSRPPATLASLWRQFLPLSLSDVTMMAGDPLITTTMAHLPDPRISLAALGIAKSLAVFFESPVIMMLHASNALAGEARSRRALWRFMLGSIALLTLLMAGLAIPQIFELVGQRLLGVEARLAGPARFALAMMCLWPAAIGWRRYYQGLLIRAGESAAIARAGLARLGVVVVCLAAGFAAKVSAVPLAAGSLILGVLIEALCVTILAHRCGATDEPLELEQPRLPETIPGVWSFYWPLASSMLVVWGGRALLVGVIARAVDGPVALAAWPAAWGLVLLVANATRMVQQVIIRNRGQVADGLLTQFAATVGSVFSLFLLALGITPPGAALVSGFVGGDPALVARVSPVVLICAVVPLLVAIQNALQGFLIGSGNTRTVTRATCAGTVLLLAYAAAAVGSGIPGATAAAVAMSLALVVEIAVLALSMPQVRGWMRAMTGLRAVEPAGSHCSV